MKNSTLRHWPSAKQKTQTITNFSFKTMISCVAMMILSSGITQAQTQLGSDIDGEAADDYSGYTVSLSSDGTHVAIGALYNDGNGNVSGQVRIYEFVPPNSPPVAICQNLSRTAGLNCTTAVTAQDFDGGSFDPDGDPLTFTISPIGPYQIGLTNVTLIVTDDSGLFSICPAFITVSDQTAPIADQATLATAQGECSVDLTAPTATDNCEGTITGTTTDATSYTDQGTYTVTWTYDDGNGNTSSQTQFVEVNDVTAPVADQATLATVQGECSVDITAPTATDNCSGVITGTTNDPTSYTVQGTYTVTWTYDDGNGNTTSQTQFVEVNDVTAPVADIASLPDATGECAVSLTAPTATDNCEGTITGTTTDPLSYTEQGTYTVTWIYDDGNGNSTTLTQTVIVDDTTAPVPDAGISIENPIDPLIIEDFNEPDVNALGFMSLPIGFDVASYNHDGSVTIADSGQGYWYEFLSDGGTSCVDYSEYAFLELEYSNTNSQTDFWFAFTTPTIDCNSTYDYYESSKPSVKKYGFTTGGNTEHLVVRIPLSAFNIDLDKMVFLLFGGFSEGSDITLHEIRLVGGATVDLDNLPAVKGECNVTLTAPTATDNCEGAITGTTTDATSYTEQGTYTVTWIYDDGNGNSSTQTQTVIVDDVTAPVADVATLADATGECEVNLTAPTATDNCEGTITGTTTDMTSYTEQGTYMVTWTYDDGNGNTSTQTQTVIVNDVTAPEIICPAIVTVAADPGICSATEVALGDATATDNCGSVTVSNDALDTYPLGTTSVIWTADDGNGQSVSCTQTVTVIDSQEPIITGCPADFVSCGDNMPTWVEPTAMDNCSPLASFTSTHVSGEELESGITEVIYTAIDQSGNFSICSFNVEVPGLPRVDALELFDTEDFCTYEKYVTAEVRNEANLTGPLDYFWSDGLGNSSTVAVPGAGTYTVTVTAASGCSAEAEVEVSAVADFDLIAANTVYLSNSTTEGNALTYGQNKIAKIYHNSVVAGTLMAPDAVITANSFVNAYDKKQVRVNLPDFIDNDHDCPTPSVVVPHTDNRHSHFLRQQFDRSK